MKFILLCFLVLGDSVEFTSSNTLSTNLVTIVANKTIEARIRTKLYECSVDSSMVEMIIAQSKFESGNFTNSLTIKHNNIFSMRHPRVRPTLSLGPLARAEGRLGYASFGSIEEATEDLVLYLEFSNYPRQLTLDQYCKLLKKKKFFESDLKHYRNGLKHFLNK